MRRRVIIVYAALLLSALAGALIGSQSPYVHAGVTANGITPAPGRHSEVRAAFAFLVKDTPNQMGWRSAEYKNEYGQAFYKTDVAPGCGEWQTVGGDARPGLLLTPGEVTCPGFRIDFGALYWFSAPPVVVTVSPTPPTSTATVTPPPPMGATATSTTVAGPTSTPSPQGEATPTATPTRPIVTITPTPTRSPITTPTVLFGNMCRPDPTPEYPHSITIYGQGGLTAPAMFWYCVPSVTPDAVFIVPEATFRAAYDNGPRKLLEDLGR